VCAVRSDVVSFYPNLPSVNESFTSQVNWNLFEGLVGFDHQYRLRPALAASWSNPDQHTSLFELRPGLSFSDGRPLRAQDVAVSLMGAKRAAFRDYFHAVNEVRAPDDGHVEIRTESPFLVILTRLPWGLVLPAEEWTREPARSVGTGPYRLVAWHRGERIELERNPFFRGPAAAYPRVTYVVLPDARERVEALRAGRVDVVDELPLEAVDELGREAGIKVKTGDGLRVMYLALRPNRPPFSDPRVREAVDLALDREELLRRAMGGRGRVATQLVPPTVVGFDPALPPPRRDLRQARELLAAAGHKGGLDVELHGANNRYVNGLAVLDEVARQLGEAGIRTRVVAKERTEFFADAAAGRTLLHLMGWSCETGDAGDVLDSVAHSKNGSGLGADNDMDQADAALDEAIRLANEATTPDLRTRYLQEAMARLRAVGVYLPLYVQPEAVAHAAHLHWDPPPGLAFSPSDMRPAG
jgi:peptide/nickel transport system substrate-binding protein